MLCDLCNKNRATVHLTEIVKGKVMELHICQKCAQLKADEIKLKLDAPGQMNDADLSISIENEGEHLCCSFCGLKFSDFKKKGRLGCAHCYTVFKAQLMPIIRRMHGRAQHKGKSPFTVTEDAIIDRKLDIFRARLATAIQLEEYEEAARLRDKIGDLEKKVH